LSADEDDARLIRELIDAWISASSARNLPALMDMMTEDVVFMTPGRAPFGKAEFTADSERMKGAAIDARAEVQEIEVFASLRKTLIAYPDIRLAGCPGEVSST
jgi:uncharacterized protein (TIGR02246 family)